MVSSRTARLPASAYGKSPGHSTPDCGLQLPNHPEQPPGRDIAVLATAAWVCDPGFRNQLLDFSFRRFQPELRVHDVTGFLLRDAGQRLARMKTRTPLLQLQSLAGEDLFKLEFGPANEWQPIESGLWHQCRTDGHQNILIVLEACDVPIGVRMEHSNTQILWGELQKLSR